VREREKEREKEKEGGLGEAVYCTMDGGRVLTRERGKSREATGAARRYIDIVRETE
jgi:hypothetical protein